MEQLLEFLFNPSHQAPSLWMLAVFVGVALVLPSLHTAYRQSRSNFKK